ncbi:MAG: hypothetical protein JSV03_01810 [Planctomycetota bacterium]|nr:MAG: hypothetical protein JSV03_01810 [Planctomycetota bacterium]
MTSPSETEPIMNCAKCGASIYQEHINRGLAGRWAGDLLCPHCLPERKKADPTVPTADDEVELALADESDGSNRDSQSGTHGLSGSSLSGAVAAEAQNFRRPLNQTGQGATRIRTFYAKFTEGAIRHMEQQVNAWLDSHPEIEVKFATTTLGKSEERHSETCLIMTIFY